MSTHSNEKSLLSVLAGWVVYVISELMKDNWDTYWSKTILFDFVFSVIRLKTASINQLSVQIILLHFTCNKLNCYWNYSIQFQNNQRRDLKLKKDQTCLYFPQTTSFLRKSIDFFQALSLLHRASLLVFSHIALLKIRQW